MYSKGDALDAPPLGCGKAAPPTGSLSLRWLQTRRDATIGVAVPAKLRERTMENEQIAPAVVEARRARGVAAGHARKRRLAEVMASPTWYWSRRESPRLATTKKGA
ncbi:hypothetical protein FIF06_22680 [Salmonella enterica subsp. enterica]|nr:hypothetical protein [Salmonella enterica subsp. enterica serovar Litchfield]